MFGVGSIVPWPMVQGHGTQNVVDTVSLSDSATFTAVFNVAASNTLTSTDQVDQYAIKERTASDTLVLADQAALVFERSVTDTIALLSIATADRTVLTSSALAVTDEATYLAVFNLSVSQGTGITDIASGYSSLITDVLVITDAAALELVRNITDTLTLTDSAIVLTERDVEDTLTLSDLASATSTSLASSVIILVDAVALMLDVSLEASSALTLTHGAIGFNENITICPDDPYGLGKRAYITLAFPFASPTTTLHLRNPRFGNSITVNARKVVRRSLGGQLLAGRIATWPTIRNLKFSFEGLSSEKRVAFLDFIEESSGYEIGLTDHENRSWRGLIVSSEVPTTQTGRYCTYSAEFDFRGYLDE